MKLIRTIKAMKKYCAAAKKSGKAVGFVPTMGYLHEGHASLIKAAAKDCDAVVVSIFVNPKQFGPSEDFGKYPRDMVRDKKISEASGADVIFFPSVEEMYPKGNATSVVVEGPLAKGLCARSRPGHFKGVTTVVAKLFNIVSPDISYFGQKDAQQAAVIKSMVKDLDMDTRVKVMPIVREKDGLARSSRNAYLSSDERAEALNVSRSLKKARELVKSGEISSDAIKGEMIAVLGIGDNTKVDYVEIVDAETLVPVDKVADNTLIAVAAFVGKTRLIDNIVIRKVSS
jgi:pantoate--beta-alanine ligase